jgi:hypothetical protein
VLSRFGQSVPVLVRPNGSAYSLHDQGQIEEIDVAEIEHDRVARFRRSRLPQFRDFRCCAVHEDASAAVVSVDLFRGFRYDLPSMTTMAYLRCSHETDTVLGPE